ncbi:hypothetical protein PHISCL_05717 [Aspergillus sclerotialis]|uniref:Rhodopsin domain-containing protein n=1 Tax=Aspergillus sclerotialis TaxID=2070753 RepID=A0A3A2ZFR6_9EURO|nr:hypothetical protein PHISCL_05717 [Aspergillus sclerotialis]
MTIPSDILAANAAGRIPNNVSLEYLAQSRDHSAIVGIIFMVCLTGVVMILRLYARFFLVKKVGFDDGLAVLATIIYIAFVVLSIVLIQMGSGRHIEYIQDVLSMPTVRDTEVVDFAAHIIYTTALLASRLSGLAFYYRLTAMSGKLRNTIIAAACFIFVSYLPQLFLLIFHCRPVTGLWPYDWQHEDTNYRCLSWGLVYAVNSGVSLACDVVMFTIPSILIKRLHVSVKRKIQLSLVMFPGVLVIVISCVRIWLVAEGQWTSDGSWAYNPMMCIENAEIAGTLIALAVPSLKPLFGTLFSHLSGYASGRTRTQTSKLQTQSKGIGTNNRNSRRLLSRSKIDEYEMMSSETSIAREVQGSPASLTSGTPGINVTSEINITRGKGPPNSQEEV